MKTTKCLLAAALAAGFATFALGGPGTPSWTQQDRARADARRPGDPVPAACPTCSTQAITERTHSGPAGQGIDTAATVGARHTRAHCAGTVTVVKGVTIDAMPHPCPMCGHQAEHCLAAVQA